MASVDDIDELIATRKLNGLDDGLYESDKNVANMTEEAFNEIIDNLEVVAYLTEYGRKGIKENVKKLQQKIKELEEPTIIQNKNIRSDKPIIDGTRLTVIDVLLFMTEFIKEHEKEFRENYADINSKQIVDSINYLLENSIPKQKIKDKIEELKKQKEELKYKAKLGLIQRINAEIKLLEELLEEGE